MVVRIVEQLDAQMAIKSDAEIALIRESVRWGNLAHRLLQRYTEVGVTETEVPMSATRDVRDARRDRWTTGRAETAGRRIPRTIGRNSALPRAGRKHRVPAGRRPTGASALLGLPELERTMVIGEPSADQERMFGHMKAVQEVAFEAIKPGAPCSHVDKAVRGYFAQHDLFAYWRHHTGHAIGLRYHEGPFLDSGDHTEIRPGMVFTVEPGLYAPDLGGFRHSDTVLITDDGIEILTTPRAISRASSFRASKRQAAETAVNPKTNQGRRGWHVAVRYVSLRAQRHRRRCNREDHARGGCARG
jgi:hypothetical protein